MNLSSPVGAHGPVEEYTLLPGFTYLRAKVLTVRFEVLWVSGVPSVSALCPISYFSIHWQIFFELCICIDIGNELFGIANGLISYIYNKIYGPWLAI